MNLADRVDRKVERIGKHHLWRGATNILGVPVMKVDGQLTTVRRVVCELASGPLPTGAKVGACADEPLCVRPEHLVMSGAVVVAHDRSRKGSRSMSEVRPGVFKLSVVAAATTMGPSVGRSALFTGVEAMRPRHSPASWPRSVTARRCRLRRPRR